MTERQLRLMFRQVERRRRRERKAAIENLAAAKGTGKAAAELVRNLTDPD